MMSQNAGPVFTGDAFCDHAVLFAMRHRRTARTAPLVVKVMKAAAKLNALSPIMPTAMNPAMIENVLISAKAIKASMYTCTVVSMNVSNHTPRTMIATNANARVVPVTATMNLRRMIPSGDMKCVST
jgi:hypothetical protein